MLRILNPGLVGLLERIIIIEIRLQCWIREWIGVALAGFLIQHLPVPCLLHWPVRQVEDVLNSCATLDNSGRTGFAQTLVHAEDVRELCWLFDQLKKLAQNGTVFDRLRRPLSSYE